MAGGGCPPQVSSFLDSSLLSTYLDSMSDLDELIADGVSSSDPAVGLRAVRALQRLQERLEAIHVANAREQGWSWQAIADALEVSRQAVHQKHNRRG
ncbi:hypothetical protein BN970_01711 [Mycolicibacterium conceptionense]|jgi:hypothetical protein|uniref:RNA polymerase subunit sigma-70 n=1 Tax=Mycolicibacterium conceptionense TaxID=451644 RepID=A0A0U1D914_9MYCO|nr:hypothetical protein BN970_01711 [Mycolicibacterium conceptionense]